MTQALLATLQSLEVELHHPGLRCDAARLEQLLHADFHEVGRSGRPYDRVTVLRFLAEQASPPPVVPSDFEVRELAPGAALLTYRSAHRRPDGSLENHTYRSSVWLQARGEWQLYYHQGTPALEISDA
ncbi:MAG: RNase [Ramlibacter sp.]|nr:RNase [Ramlibacter sp.]MDF2467261.1 RNase [Ramlibacter sp.]